MERKIYSFLNEDSANVTFSSDEMGILSVDLNNINLNNANFYEHDSNTITHVRLVVWCNKLKQHKVFRKGISKKLRSIARHPKI